MINNDLTLPINIKKEHISLDNVHFRYVTNRKCHRNSLIWRESDLEGEINEIQVNIWKGQCQD